MTAFFSEKVTVKYTPWMRILVMIKKTISGSKEMHQVPLRVDYYSQMVLEDHIGLEIPKVPILLSSFEHSKASITKGPGTVTSSCVMKNGKILMPQDGYNITKGC